MALFGKAGSPGLGGPISPFRSVLTKLATDKGYLQVALDNPSRLIEDFPDLTIQELDALRDAAALSGVDLSKIDPLHANVSSARPGSGVTLGGDGCCCCCCCGTTGEVVRI